MEYSCKWVEDNINADTPSQPYPCEWVAKNWSKQKAQAETPYPCKAIENYYVPIVLGVTPSAATGTYWGTATTAMQSDIAVANGAITGTLKYLDSGQLVTDWGEGNFMALKFTVPANATSCKVGLNPSEGSGLVELDDDKDGVFKITNKDTQKFVIVTTDGVYTNTQEFDLSGLTCETE